MNDIQIVTLFWERADNAIAEAQSVYGAYCRRIADNILHCNEDAEECVNDTFLRTWEAIPPARPTRLAPFLGAITRHLALDRYAAYHAQKRTADRTATVLEEWAECTPAASLSDTVDTKDLFERFLRTLSPTHRRIFLLRYWYAHSISEIAHTYGFGESKVKMILARTRTQLKAFLEKEGIQI